MQKHAQTMLFKDCRIAPATGSAMCILLFCQLALYCMQAIVKSLGMLSTESTANVSPALAKLQMFQTMSEAWPQRWADRSPSAGSTSSQGGARQPLVPDDAALAKLQAMWKHREAVTGLLWLLPLNILPSMLPVLKTHDEFSAAGGLVSLNLILVLSQARAGGMTCWSQCWRCGGRCWMCSSGWMRCRACWWMPLVRLAGRHSCTMAWLLCNSCSSGCSCWTRSTGQDLPWHVMGRPDTPSAATA